MHQDTREKAGKGGGGEGGEGERGLSHVLTCERRKMNSSPSYFWGRRRESGDCSAARFLSEKEELNRHCRKETNGK